MQKGANARATCAILCIINIEPKTVLQMYIKNRIRIRIILSTMFLLGDILHPWVSATSSFA